MSVYKLTCSETKQIYYGSTKMTLKKRKNKGWYKCSCKDFINPLMECIEVVDNLEELEMRENHYIMNNECVNKQVAYLDETYKKIRDKKWRDMNIERIKEIQKLNHKKVMDEKRHECQLCNLCFGSHKKLERHKNGYRHKLKNESFIKYGEDWKKYYLEDNKKRYKEIRRAKNKSV